MKAYRARLTIVAYYSTEEEANAFALTIARAAKLLGQTTDALDGRTVGNVESGDLLTPEEAKAEESKATAPRGWENVN